MTNQVVDGAQRVQWGTLVMADTATECEKKDGGTYPGCEIIWKYHGQGKAQTTAIHERVFSNIPGAKAVIEGLQKGDEFCMLQERKGEYWNNKEFAAGKDTLKAEGVVIAGPTAGGGGPSYKSNKFPVPKDDLGISICRQSSLQRAIEVLTISGVDPERPVTEITALAISLAREFEGYVTGHEG